MDIGTLIGMFFAGLGIAVAVVSSLVRTWLMVPRAFNRNTGFRQVFQSGLGSLRPLVCDDETLTRLPFLMPPFFSQLEAA